MQIKFRGLRTNGSGYAVGELTTFIGHPQICFNTEQGWKVENVDERTIRQFATTDSNGKEVYAGEIVHAGNGEDYFVELRPVFVNVDGGETLINPPKKFWLKEYGKR